MKVAYILNSFPNVSTTFIINEIVAMQNRKVDVDVFAFYDPKETVVHPKVHQIKNVHYFTSRQYLKIIFFHFYWLCVRPHRYLLTALLSLWPNNGLFTLFILGMPYVHRVYLQKPDLLHAHFGTRPADFCMLVKLLTGIPFTFTTHGYDVHREPAKNYWLKTILAYKHITISEFNRKLFIKKFRVPSKKMTVIRCGIDFKNPLPTAEPAEENIIIAVARLLHLKGLDVLIQACKQLSDENVNFKCMIIGDGPEKNRLTSLIEQLGLTNKVLLLGPLPHNEVFNVLGKSRLMVLPSRSESLSVALMEAMACHVPVIGPNIMGNPELVTDGESGFLVKPNDIDDLSYKMKRLLSDRALHAKFRRSAFEKVSKDFNLFKETQKLFKVWQECTAS